MSKDCRGHAVSRDCRGLRGEQGLQGWQGEQGMQGLRARDCRASRDCSVCRVSNEGIGSIFSGALTICMLQSSDRLGGNALAKSRTTSYTMHGWWRGRR